MVDALLDELARMEPSGQFVPCCYYSKDSDSITLYFDDQPDFSRALTSRITVHLSLDSHEPVGCQIHGISNLLKEIDNFLDVSQQPNLISIILWAEFMNANSQTSETLRKLGALAKKWPLQFKISST